MRGAVERERMVRAFDAENSFVGAEVDLHHHVLPRHLLQQRRGVVLVHHVHAVADALGVPQLHGLANVEAQALGRHQARRQLAGVQRDVDLGINGMQIVQHLHLQRVIAHGDEAVFGLHKVDADPGVVVRVHAGLDGLKAQQRLREDLLGRKPRSTW